MPRVHLDIAALAYPSSAEGSAAMRSYVQGLLDWRAVLRDGWLPVLLPGDASDILGAADRFPPWKGLAETLRAAGVIELEEKDIFQLLNGILQRAGLVEEAAGVDEVLCEDEDVFPPIDEAKRGPVLSCAYRRLLAMACVCASAGDGPVADQCVGLSPSAEPAHDVRYTGRLLDYEARPGRPLSLHVPLQLTATFPASHSRAELYRRANAERVWVTSTTSEMRRGAVCIAKDQYLSAAGGATVPGYRRAHWKFGSAFLDSAERTGFMNSESQARALLRAIVESLVGVSRGRHAIRTTSGGNAPQVERNGALAWRRDIDYEYHLHYWDGPAGCEFANVAHHCDLHIQY